MGKGSQRRGIVLKAAAKQPSRNNQQGVVAGMLRAFVERAEGLHILFLQPQDSCMLSLAFRKCSGLLLK